MWVLVSCIPRLGVAKKAPYTKFSRQFLHIIVKPPLNTFRFTNGYSRIPSIRFADRKKKWKKNVERYHSDVCWSGAGLLLLGCKENLKAGNVSGSLHQELQSVCGARWRVPQWEATSGQPCTGNPGAIAAWISMIEKWPSAAWCVQCRSRSPFRRCCCRLNQKWTHYGRISVVLPMLVRCERWWLGMRQSQFNLRSHGVLAIQYKAR